MTRLSVNLNKIALLRNSRGRDYPNLLEYAGKLIDLGVNGITIHPRSDERHAKRQDAVDLGEMLARFEEVEFNIEGYPSEEFLQLVERVRPDQCTLVPDGEDQITSDHGWDISGSSGILDRSLQRLQGAGIRCSLFLDPTVEQVRAAAQTGTERIELYTEEYARSHGLDTADAVFHRYREAVRLAEKSGLGVNAGHDLDLNNLARFLEIGNILEVSIGHALTIECIDFGMEEVVSRYLEICA